MVAHDQFDGHRELFLRHPQPMWVFELASLRFLEVNDAACEQYGYSRAEFLDMTTTEIRPTQDQPMFFEHVHNLEASAPAAPTLWRHKKADGTIFYSDVTSRPIDFYGTPARIVIASDATQRLSVSRALFESRAALAEAQELAHLGSFDCDITNNEIRWSVELYRILGVDPARERPRMLYAFDHPDDRLMVVAEIDRARAERRPYTVEHRIVRRDGEVRFVFERGQFFFKDGETTPSRAIGAVLDITDRKGAEEQLRALAEHDALTGLPNRSLTATRLVEAIARAEAAGTNVGVFFLDLDRFKAINDTIGHGAGDRIVSELAQRLAGRLGDRGTIGRPGGDEFIVTFETSGREEALQLGRDLLAAAAEPLPYETTHIVTTASIGIAFYPTDGTTPDELLRAADTAMYAAKATGGNSVEVYSREMHDKTLADVEMERALRAALDRDAIFVHYQPIVDARTSQIVALEALVRWTENGLPIAPNDFIPLAEETGIIVRLGTYVLERACAFGAALAAEGYPDLTMCVNISARQFRELDFAGRVSSALRTTGLEPSRLQLEITESAYISADAGVRNVQALAALGVELSIDDFGTGYSALGYLKRLSVDALKIDRSFVEDIVTDAADQAIVRAIIAVAQNLDLDVIAEGVETAEQAAILRMLGCTQLQGFYFARPLSPDALRERLRKPA